MTNTTTDALLKRLRDRSSLASLSIGDAWVSLDEAADAIERLTAERDALRDLIDGTLAQATARLEKCEAERDAALKDALRLREALVGCIPLFDGLGGIDLHEQASVYASAFGRDTPTEDDYIAAMRDAIDAALAAQYLAQPALSMSMFVSRADYDAAIAAQKGDDHE